VDNIGLKKDWTFLLYQGGVNNLDSSLAKNLKELSNCPHPENVDILVRQIDAQGCQNDYHLDSQGLISLHQPKADVDSSSPATLSEFLRDGIKAYPAKHYMLAISSHGKGAEGVIEDERQHKMMSLPELRSALELVGQPIDVVYFDACRMMTTEVASELQNSAEVMIGSMDRIDSAGYDPSQMLLAISKSADAKDLGTRLVNNFEDRQLITFRSLSAVDLGQIGPLENAFNQLSQELAKLDPESAQQVRETVLRSRRATPSPMYLEGLDAMADSILSGNTSELSDWLEQIRPSSPISVLSLCHDLADDPKLNQANPELTQAAKAAIQAHNQAVFAQRNPDCDGLSVMLPIEQSGQVSDPKLAFERATDWQTAVNHIIPPGTPAKLPKTWLELELASSPASDSL
jgi:hypothetical protein